jgi:hypothetical protein
MIVISHAGASNPIVRTYHGTVNGKPATWCVRIGTAEDNPELLAQGRFRENAMRKRTINAAHGPFPDWKAARDAITCGSVRPSAIQVTTLKRFREIITP